MSLGDEVTIDKNDKASLKVWVPNLGATVYTLYKKELEKNVVGFLGKDSFIIKDFDECRIFESLEYKYLDYNITWFTSLQKAENILSSDGKQLKKKYTNYWEVIDK